MCYVHNIYFLPVPQSIEFVEFWYTIRSASHELVPQRALDIRSSSTFRIVYQSLLCDDRHKVVLRGGFCIEKSILCIFEGSMFRAPIPLPCTNTQSTSHGYRISIQLCQPCEVCSLRSVAMVIHGVGQTSQCNTTAMTRASNLWLSQGWTVDRLVG